MSESLGPVVKSKLEIERNGVDRLEDLPHVNINVKVKYFETVIEKENQGFRDALKRASDLKKYMGRNDRRWARERHMKYSTRKGKYCGSPACRNIYCTGESCSQTVGSGPGPESSPNVNDAIDAGLVSKEKQVDFEEEVSAPAGQTDSMQQLTDAALSSHALVLSKEFTGVLEVSNASDFRRELIEAGPNLVVCMFYAPWCRPCQKVQPIFLSLAGTYPAVKFMQANVDNKAMESVITDDLDVGHIPSFYFFRDAVQVSKVEGDLEQSVLEGYIKNYGDAGLEGKSHK